MTNTSVVKRLIKLRYQRLEAEKKCRQEAQDNPDLQVLFDACNEVFRTFTQFIIQGYSKKLHVVFIQRKKAWLALISANHNLPVCINQLYEVDNTIYQLMDHQS